MTKILFQFVHCELPVYLQLHSSSNCQWSIHLSIDTIFKSLQLLERWCLLTRKLMNQVFLDVKSSTRMLYDRHHDFAYRYGINASYSINMFGLSQVQFRFVTTNPRNFNKNSTSGARITYLYGVYELTHAHTHTRFLLWSRVVHRHCSVQCFVDHYLSFVSFFFSWGHCLFFDVRIMLINPLISSNFCKDRCAITVPKYYVDAIYRLYLIKKKYAFFLVFRYMH